MMSFEVHQIWVCGEKPEVRVSRSSTFFKTTVNRASDDWESLPSHAPHLSLNRILAIIVREKAGTIIFPQRVVHVG